MKLKLLLAVLLSCQLLTEQTRREINLKTWEFSRDQQTWEKVDIPHDWAIAGPFDKKWDLQRVAIVQNGETEATEKSGRSGALPWIGEGWYRTTISVPEGYWNLNYWGYKCYYDTEDYGAYCFIEKDGNTYGVNHLLVNGSSLYIGYFEFTYPK